jgi:hypothetical protein
MPENVQTPLIPKFVVENKTQPIDPLVASETFNGATSLQVTARSSMSCGI